MAVSSIDLIAPPPTTYPDGVDGILRPEAVVQWTGGVGPFNVTHEWDTVNTFDSGSLLTDTNNGVTSPDTGVPPGDLGGGTWFYRATVTDTDDSVDDTSAVVELTWFDQIEFDRFLYLLANAGVSFYPTDTAILAEAADGDTRDFDRFLYALAYLTSDVPTPHIWYVFPSFGREGWEFKVVGYGFGDTQGTYNGAVLLNALGCSVLSWTAVAESSTDLTIDPVTDIAEPIHQEVRCVVPAGAESGLVFVTTDA